MVVTVYKGRCPNRLVIVSGGAVGEPGNMPSPAGSVAEWNVGVDPAAAEEVLHARVPTEWIAVDATNDVPADIWFTQALAGQARSRAGELALSFLRANPALTSGGFYFWDPLAAVAMTDPQTVTYQTVRMSVTTSGAQSGRTAIDPAGPQVSVAVKADPTRFAGMILQAFSLRVRRSAAMCGARRPCAY
jgi:inosine-uridine nucleoside N-ribohydrolase